MGTVLVRAGAYAKAVEQFRAILQVAPDDAAAEVGLAAALRGEAGGKGAEGAPKLDEAKAHLEKVLDRDPHNVSALFNLGVLYADFLKRPESARPLFARFLNQAPEAHPSRAQAEKYASILANAAPAAAPAPGPAPAPAPAPAGTAGATPAKETNP
jgi:tetratricopeptide (TPR) repeat protein